MDVLLEQVVFSVGADPYRWEDVMMFAQLRGDWAVLEKRLREGFACLACLNDFDEELESTEVETAANEFRYERDLVTAAEAEAWLRQWHLSAEAWMEYVQRSLLRQKWAAQLAEIVARYPVGKKFIKENLYAEAVCSGALARFARALAARVAAYHMAVKAGWIAAAPHVQAADKVALFENTYQRFCDRVVDSKGINNQIQLHHLEWIRFHCRSLSFPAEEVAREALLCARDEGMALEAVAANAKVEIKDMKLYIEEVALPSQNRFLAAPKGAIIGPVEWEGSFALFVIDEKTLPSADDVDIVQRARQSLIRRTTQREIAARVKWHAQL